LRVQPHFAAEFLRERLHNHHLLKTPRVTQDSQLFHREHGRVGFDIRASGIPFSNNWIGSCLIVLARQGNLGIHFLQVIPFC